jgi:hypothetical protein
MQPIWSGYVTGSKGRTGVAMIWDVTRPPAPETSEDENDKEILKLTRKNKELYQENIEIMEMNRNLRREYKTLMKKYRDRLG